MGANQSIRATLAFAAVATTVWAVVTVRWTGESVGQALLYTPLFFAMIFFTMRITNRLTGALGRRVAKPSSDRSDPPPPLEPSSKRPEHALRRRAVRRPRGGDRRRR